MGSMKKKTFKKFKIHEICNGSITAVYAVKPFVSMCDLKQLYSVYSMVQTKSSQYINSFICFILMINLR